ncbi:protein FAM53C-like isoform 1-T2 [Salvelinus alpinus]|uniref:protein FAM53C-like n=1 Tax=Salvelinus alpinus TaxID=8036 RepID=UPI0039FCE99D
MVTLITEQLRRQNLEEPPYRRAFSLNVSLPEVGSSPTVCWRGYGLTPESSWSMFPSSKTHLQDSVLSSLDPLGTPLPSTSVTNMSLQSSPPLPPPPPKRHCRSLSVPEDLSRCRTPWRPSASKIWTPVKRRCHSGGGVAGMGVGSLVGSVPLRGPSSSLTSSLHSSSSPTFFSLALSPDSTLPWSVSWDHNDPPRESCTGLFPSSCSSSPATLGSCRPLQQRRFSLSPVHILPPQPSPALASRYIGMEAPALSPAPSSACSTPSSSRRVLPLRLPRCHSQPCDLRKPGLKRRHDPDTLPNYTRPGLDFSKMTQIRSGEPLVCGAAVCMGLEPVLGDFRGTFSPADLLGRTSIGPLSESEEEEEKINMGVLEAGQQSVFERDCTELDLNLIEEN